MLDTSTEQLTCLGRIRLGYTASIVPIEAQGGARLVAGFTSEFRAPNILGEATPFGMAGEIGVIALHDGALHLEQRLTFPKSADGQAHIHLHDIELDGRPPTEIVANIWTQQAGDNRNIVWFLRNRGGRLDSIGRLGGADKDVVFGVNGVLTGENDRDQLLVNLPDAYAVMGVGDEVVYASPEFGDGPTDGPAWLFQIGLHEAAATAYERRALIDPTDAPELLAAAANAWAEAERFGLASRRFEEAAGAAMPTDPRHLDNAIEYALKDNDFPRAQALLSTSPDADPDMREAAQVITNPLTLRFDEPLHPAWQIATPEAVTQNLAAGALTIRRCHWLGGARVPASEADSRGPISPISRDADPRRAHRKDPCRHRLYGRHRAAPPGCLLGRPGRRRTAGPDDEERQHLPPGLVSRERL